MASSPTCPRCARPLQSAAGGASTCAGCGGVFLPEALAAAVAALDFSAEDAVAAARHAGRQAAAPSGQRGDAGCPVCGAKMARVRVGLALEMDQCAHGTWFDAGEVDRLRDALARGGRPTPVEPHAPAKAPPRAVTPARHKAPAPPRAQEPAAALAVDPAQLVRDLANQQRAEKWDAAGPLMQEFKVPAGFRPGRRRRRGPGRGQRDLLALWDWFMARPGP